MTEPGTYEFIVMNVQERGPERDVLLGEVAKSPPYRHNMEGAAPIDMPATMPGWSSIIASERAFMAIKADNSLWGWGTDNRGQLGLGNTGERTSIPEPVKIMDGVISAGLSSEQSFVIRADGSLWVAGNYYRGNASVRVNTHVKLMDDVASAVIGGNRELFAIKTDGSLWHWSGHLTDNPDDSPYKVTDGIISAAFGGPRPLRGYAVRADGSLWSLIGDGSGRGGVGLNQKIMDDVSYVARNAGRSFVITTDGGLWSWGSNRAPNGLGDGTAQDRAEPVRIMENVASISFGNTHTLVVRTDGSLWGWGQNRVEQNEATGVAWHGPLGPQTVPDTTSPIRVDDGYVYAVAVGHSTYAVKTDGSLWRWGVDWRPNQFMTGLRLTPPTTTAPAVPTTPTVPSAPGAGGGISVLLNGSPMTFDVQPQLMNGRTMVPLRAIFEAMGAEIEWDGTTRTATATRGDTVVVLTIGSTSPTVNGQVVPIDQPGVIVDGRTLAPLRFVAEAFGGSVEWDGATRTATITSP
jgi:alpha-tubulin suppressor-like RCC1 family protein